MQKESPFCNVLHYILNLQFCEKLVSKQASGLVCLWAAQLGWKKLWTSFEHYQAPGCPVFPLYPCCNSMFLHEPSLQTIALVLAGPYCRKYSDLINKRSAQSLGLRIALGLATYRWRTHSPQQQQLYELPSYRKPLLPNSLYASLSAI